MPKPEFIKVEKEESSEVKLLKTSKDDVNEQTMKDAPEKKAESKANKCENSFVTFLRTYKSERADEQNKNYRDNFLKKYKIPKISDSISSANVSEASADDSRDVETSNDDPQPSANDFSSISSLDEAVSSAPVESFPLASPISSEDSNFSSLRHFGNLSPISSAASLSPVSITSLPLSGEFSLIKTPLISQVEEIIKEANEKPEKRFGKLPVFNPTRNKKLGAFIENQKQSMTEASKEVGEAAAESKTSNNDLVIVKRKRGRRKGQNELDILHRDHAASLHSKNIEHSKVTRSHPKSYSELKQTKSEEEIEKREIDEKFSGMYCISKCFVKLVRCDEQVTKKSKISEDREVYDDEEAKKTQVERNHILQDVKDEALLKTKSNGFLLISGVRSLAEA